MEKITVNLGNAYKDVYITQRYGREQSASPFHAHSYTEVHLVYRGCVRFLVGDAVYDVAAGEMIALPANVYHIRLSCPGDTALSAFQIDVSLKEVRKQRFSAALIEECREAAEKADETGDFNDFAMLLSLLVSRFFRAKGAVAEPIRDESFIINEFLSNNYNRNVKLAELAAQLCVSEKQAERLVKKHTGVTFKQALTATRGVIAEHLVRTQNLPLSEVAKLVGYKSYNGFWKAHMRKPEEA